MLDIVVMEAPAYTAAIDVLRWQGATILSVPVDKDGMQIDLLLRLCDTYTPKLKINNISGSEPLERQ